MKMLLFDIDGTLLHTGGVGQTAFEKAFHELYGVPDCWGSLIPDGKTDPLIVDEITGRVLGRKLTKAEYSRLCRRYHHHFSRDIQRAERYRLMPHAREILSRLSRRKDCLLGVATGNFEKAAWHKLKRGGLERFFKFGGFGSDSHNRAALTRRAMLRGLRLAAKSRKKIAKDSIYVIGDTQHDVMAGSANGLRTIAVTTGRMKRRDFLQYKPDFIIRDLARFPWHILEKE